MNLHELIDRLHKEHTLTRGEFITLIKERDEENASYLASLAREEAVKIYENGVFPRGLVEFTNYCKNNCYYCGIQGNNQHANRYRLSKDEILSACENGYQLGYRSFVLQGGEDPHYSDDVMVPKKAIRSYTMLEPTDICFAMKLLLQNFIRNCTLKVYLQKTGFNVYGI